MQFWDYCSIASRILSSYPQNELLNFTFRVLTNILCRRGHYNRALEEAISTHKAQWSKDWKDNDGKDKNPLSGGATFNTMSPTERVGLQLFLQLQFRARFPPRCDCKNCY